MTTASIPNEVRERIIATANELYEKAGRQGFPTVDAVRRSSRADMNAVSAVMKEWRQSQTVQAAPVAVAVPESILQAGTVAMAAVWQQATDLANQSLRTAQAAWESERAELDGMREELANGFEAQAQELDALKSKLAEYVETIAGQKAVLDTLAQQEADAVARAETAEARNEEIEIRANDLHTELDRAHQEIDRMRQDQILLRNKANMDADKHADEVKQFAAISEGLRSDLVKLQAKFDSQTESHAEQRKKAAAELERHTAEFKQLAAENEALRSDLVKLQSKAEAQTSVDTELLKRAGEELKNAMERLKQAQADREALQESATIARERAATLAGHLEATKIQNAALLAAFKPQEPAPAAVEVAAKAPKVPKQAKGSK